MADDLNKQSTTGRRWTRRFWLKSAAGCCAAGVGTAGWTVLIEPRWLAIEYVDLKLPNLPSHWNGRRLVQISDLHVGQVTTSYLQSAMQTVNSLEPDLVAITGDFIDRTGGIGAELESVLSELKPAKLGSVACLGNHDYGLRWSQSNIADRVVDTAREHGIQVLRDERVNVDGLEIMGLDDYWSPRRNPQAILQSADPNKATICLNHNPDACDRYDWSRFQGAVLSGHTHGGQCKPPFLPPPILPVKNPRYTSGFFDLGPGQQLYISRGVGHTFRVRFNCRPEITVFNLTPA